MVEWWCYSKDKQAPCNARLLRSQQSVSLQTSYHRKKQAKTVNRSSADASKVCGCTLGCGIPPTFGHLPAGTGRLKISG